MQIDLIGGSYVQKYPEVNTEKTVNWYVVPRIGTAKDKVDKGLYPTPGLTAFTTSGGTNARNVYYARTLTSERCFTIIDQTLYEVSSGGTLTSRGTLSAITNNATTVYMVNNTTDLGIFHSSGAYTFTFASNTLTQIVDADYPGMEHITYMDGYVIVVKNGRIYWCDVNDMANWTASSTFTPTDDADAVRAVSASNGVLCCFGSSTTEIYISDGTPFSRLSQGSSLIGIHAIESLVNHISGRYFLGRTKSGQTAVYYLNQQYRAEQISPFSITWALNNTSTDTTDAYGYIQDTKDGHSWYYLTVPALDTTYVYDINIKEWTERKSKNPSSSTIAEFRGRHFTNFAGVNLFTDIYTGKLLKEDFTVQTEDSQAITRIRTSGVFNSQFQFISVYSIELDTSSLYGDTLSVSNPVIVLEYSTDGGANYTTWGNLYLREGAAPGDINHRTRALKLGTGLNWVVRWTLTDAVDVAIFGAVAHGVVGNA